MNAAQKKEIAKLRKMKLNELQARFQEATGESTRCPNRKYLIRRIEEAIAEPAPEPPPADEVTRRPSQLEQQEEAAEAGPAASSPSPKGGRFGSLTIDELRARYHEIVGRPTGSDDRRYIVWKIREAEKGHITVGPRPASRRSGETRDFQVLPLRLRTSAIERLDEVWRAHGLMSRTDLVRRALGHYLTSLGAGDVAALFAPIS